MWCEQVHTVLLRRNCTRNCGIERKGHEVMFSVSVKDGIKRISNAFRYPSKECTEITQEEFKAAAKKTLNQMFNNFNLI